MKKSLIILLIAASFCLGFGLNAIIAKQTIEEAKMKKVTGIGGVFFKCNDPKAVNEWYKTHLGMEISAYGANFEWKTADEAGKSGSTAWNTFPEHTKYFEPSSKDFMINYRVENLEALVEELKKEGVTVVDEIATYDFGKFVHIIDLEGNKLELWEPTE